MKYYKNDELIIPNNISSDLLDLIKFSREKMNSEIQCTRKNNPCKNTYCDNPINGFVGNEEKLLRMIFYPHHYDKTTGMISPAAFSRKELNERGLSVNRKEKISADDYKELIGRMDNEKRKVKDIGLLETEKIRKFLNMFVCPSGHSKNKSHADVYLKPCIDHAHWNELRFNLQELLSIYCVDNFLSCWSQEENHSSER